MDITGFPPTAGAEAFGRGPNPRTALSSLDVAPDLVCPLLAAPVYRRSGSGRMGLRDADWCASVCRRAACPMNPGAFGLLPLGARFHLGLSHLSAAPRVGLQRVAQFKGGDGDGLSDRPRAGRGERTGRARGRSLGLRLGCYRAGQRCGIATAILYFGDWPVAAAMSRLLFA